jgi:hypothetical protein
MLQIQVLKIFIGSWWGDIRVRTWNLVKNRKFHLLDEGGFLSSKWPNRDIINTEAHCYDRTFPKNFKVVCVTFTFSLL